MIAQLRPDGSTHTIDNSDGVLPIEFTEVTITRTLFRSGDSEYAINGVPCLENEIMYLEPGDVLVLGDARFTLRIVPDSGEDE